MIVNELYGTSSGCATKEAEDEVMIVNTAYMSSEDLEFHASGARGNTYEDVQLNSSTNVTGTFVSVPGSSGAQPSASVKKGQTSIDEPTSDDASNLYTTVNKGTKPSQKPANKSKPGKLEDKPSKKKIAKKDNKQLLHTGEYGNVGMAYLTMSPHMQEGSVYENYAFEKEESTKERPFGEVSSCTVDEDGLVYTTVAFSDKQLKKAAEPPPEREQTEYAGIDFARKSPPTKANE